MVGCGVLARAIGPIFKRVWQDRPTTPSSSAQTAAQAPDTSMSGAGRVWRLGSQLPIVRASRSPTDNRYAVMSDVVIRAATPADQPDLRRAMIALQEHESRLHATRLPGEQIADAYLARLQGEAAEKSGAILVAEKSGVFAGFIVGWIAQHYNIPETADSNRFGFVSDICVMPPYRGQRIAHRLLGAIERYLDRAGVTRLRLYTLAANASARASYESAGFAPYEIVYEKLVET